MGDNKFKFGELKVRTQRMQRELPVLLANQAQNYFLKAFSKESLGGVNWQKPKRTIAGTKEYEYPKSKGLSRRTKPTLVMAGTLKRAVSNSVRSAVFGKIKLVVDLPYAARHNEGLDGMPERPFMKDTAELREMHTKKIKNYTDKLWQG